MDRKVALAAAAAVVLTVSAGTAAVAANVGLLSSTADDTVGQLQPARDDGSPTRTIVIEEVIPAEEPLLTPGAAADDDGDDDEDDGDEDDDRYEDEDDRYEEHEGEDHEGRDDDD